jgi:CopG-like RHH_1 or ribbon-helix-helix domain, RHH_5
MSHRVQVVLPDPVAAQLHELADAAGEPHSTLAAQLIRHAIAQAASDGKVRPLRQPPVVTEGRTGERPRWLEPYGGDDGWSAEMWGQIVTLRVRYPGQLAHLKDQWWTDEAKVEILSALAVWRADLDNGGVDPREELAFHTQLADYAHVLRQEGGGVTKEWRPGAPPDEWTRLSRQN